MSTTNPTGTGLGLNPSLHGVRPANNFQSHGTDWRLLGTQILGLYSPRPKVKDMECRKCKKKASKTYFRQIIEIEIKKANKTTVE